MRIAGAVVLICAMSATAHAAEDEKARKERARAMWHEGADLYDAGDLDKALVMFERSHALDPNPAILFNMCQA
jgi:hypothetical protein